MRYLLISLAILFLSLTCAKEDLTFWDINTGWEKDTTFMEDDTSGDISDNNRIYEYACTDVSSSSISVEGRVIYDGEIPDAARLSVAITNSPPPGMPSCYFTVKPREFPFGFRFTGLKKDSEIYIMAVLKMDGASIPIPKEGIDYYGDYKKTPIKITEDIKGVEIILRLYQKE